MTTQTVDTTLWQSAHPHIAKRISLTGILYSVVMLLAGLFLFVFDFEIHDKSSALSMTLMVIGTALILYAVYRIFWRSSELVYLPTGSVAKEYSLFYDLKHLNTLTDLLNHGCPDASHCMKGEASGNVRLDIMLSRDNRFAAVQLFQFVPYSYMPVTEVRYYTDADAASVSAFLLKSRL